MRNLVLVLGDQLTRSSAAFDGFDRMRDAVWMAEVADESERTWSTLPRIAMFLAAMRHFGRELENDRYPLIYRRLESSRASAPGHDTLAAALADTLRAHRPQHVIVVKPGEWGVLASVQDALAAAGTPLEIRPDRHFICTDEQFARHAQGRKQLRMEYFYREMRARSGVLVSPDGKPEGGSWNYDKENRKSFGTRGPGKVPEPVAFEPDTLTTQALDDVRARFGTHAGSLERFDFPVTRAQALAALEDFITHRLAAFGNFQDAMWTGEPWLYHSRVSASMNLKLLDPREVIAAAEAAYRAGRAPLAAAEGFIRQILGWREYVHGVYWHLMPGYLDRNELGASARLPAFYWDAKTDMHCLHQVISQTLARGYAHHIQRLMVTGLFALLLGVHPRRVHEWYLAVYVDAVEWVELPNTLGMSQYGDRGVMGSKPYVASGRYIQRMSNYCVDCRYDPAKSVGEDACPFTTLYWDFLGRHHRKLGSNPRMTMQLRNLARLSAADRRAITRRAAAIRAKFQ